MEQQPIDRGRQDAVLSGHLDRLRLPRHDLGHEGAATIHPTRWLHEMLGRVQRALTRRGGGPPERRVPPPALREPVAPPVSYKPLRRVVVADGVARQMLDEYAAHQRSERGEEETGWVLLGRRLEDEAHLLASLPAGADREAGEAHVLFNGVAQGIASWIVRQTDKRLTMLGVVHTHPGSLRHPSDGDYRGDIEWVGQLRGGEGVFGIGTADGKYSRPSDEVWHPRPNMACRRELSLTWYTLRDGARSYQAVPIELASGPDLAAPLRLAWDVLEDHAPRLERLALQQAKLQIEVTPAGLAVNLSLAQGSVLRATLSKEGVRYFVARGGDQLAADLREPKVDRGIYQLLAELAGGDE